jgi:hypothetical protein
MMPSPARMYDYLIGGKDNFAADRAGPKELMSAFPGARRVARANRGFLVRALWFLAARGIHQYIDLGTGFPTSPNVHEVTRHVLPDAGVVYVDNDPVVTAHNRALQATTPGVAAVHGDIRRPGEILGAPDLLSVIDFADPVAVPLVGAAAPVIPRTSTEVAAFFDGCELIEPGLVDVTRWRPERHMPSGGIRVAAGVGRKTGSPIGRNK